MNNPQVKVAIEMDDGSLVIMSFITESGSPTLPSGARWLAVGHWIRPATEENVAAELKRAFQPFDQLGQPKPQPVSWRVIDEQSIPMDRSYRNAWRLSGEKIEHHMDKARELHREKLRRRRMERLVVLDVDWSRATARGDKTGAKNIETERQKLRDVTDDSRIDAAQTIDELKAIELP